MDSQTTTDPLPATIRADIEFLERWVDLYCESNNVGAAILRLTKWVKEQKPNEH